MKFDIPILVIGAAAILGWLLYALPQFDEASRKAGGIFMVIGLIESLAAVALIATRTELNPDFQPSGYLSAALGCGIGMVVAGLVLIAVSRIRTRKNSNESN